MAVRDACRNDLPFILELMNNAILKGTSIYEAKARDQNFIETWFSKKQAEKFPVLVYDINQKPRAFATYGAFRSGSAYRLSVEQSIHVHKNFQGKGIGKQLLLFLIERAKKEGRHAMIAGIDSENRKSLRFHKNMGFQEVGKFPEIAFKFEKWLDVVLLQLMLNPNS